MITPLPSTSLVTEVDGECAADSELEADTVPSTLITAPDSGHENAGGNELSASMPFRVVSVMSSK